MLIQITNKCHEGCRHCMQHSNPNGEHMDFATFKQAVKFGAFLGSFAFIISGGEPTEHPQFSGFCMYLDKFISQNNMKAEVVIASNGTWFPDKKKIMERLLKLRSFAGMQVYTNPKWYKSSDFILQHKNEIEAIPGIAVETADIISMQDLGRAKTSAEAQAEVALNKHYMSCLNGHLLFKQVSVTHKLEGLIRPELMCKPMVDFKGEVHLSESWLCPSFGNVNSHSPLELFNNLKASKPCCECFLGRKFLASQDAKIVAARKLLQL